MTRFRPTAFLLIAFALAGTSHAKLPPSGRWTLDPERSSVRFTIAKFGKGDVEGRFARFEGEILFDAANPKRSSMRWRVRVSSVQTGEPERDSTLLGDGYFAAHRFPELIFESRRVRPLPDGRIRVEGTITIRGRSRPLTIDARPIRMTPSAPVYETRFTLDRFDFGVDGARMAVGRDVHVHLIAAGAPRSK